MTEEECVHICETVHRVINYAKLDGLIRLWPWGWPEPTAEELAHSGSTYVPPL